MTSQPITISPTGSSSPGNNNNRNNNKHYSNSMRRFRSAMSTMSLSSSTPRKPDIHIETRQGKHHADDGIPNQDMAFALTRYELAPSSTTTTQSSSGHGSNSPFRFVNGGSGNVSGNGNGKKRRRVAAAGVFDGHGIDGHSASRLACKRMECAVDTLLANYYSSINVNNNAEETTTTTTIDDRDDNGRLAGVLEKAFRETAAMLDGATCGNGSGTTGSVVAIYGDDVCMSWVGDSVIVVIDDTPNIRFASPMHRVTDDTEAARILSAGGRIQDGYVVDTDAKNVSFLTSPFSLFLSHSHSLTLVDFFSNRESQ